MSPLILLIEDCEDLQLVYIEIFKKMNALTYTAESGKKALAFLENGLPDVIIMDLTLPDMETHEFLHAYRQIPSIQLIPLILISGRENIAFWAKEFRATHFFKKPVELDDLVNYVGQVASGTIQDSIPRA